MDFCKSLDWYNWMLTKIL